MFFIILNFSKYNKLHNRSFHYNQSKIIALNANLIFKIDQIFDRNPIKNSLIAEILTNPNYQVILD